MNLGDALDGWPSGGNNQPAEGGVWPGQPTNPTWPAQPSANPTWPAGGPASNPTWPAGGPASNPTWPAGGPASNPTWPAGGPASNPTWPAGQPASGGAWPSPGPGPGPGFPVAPQQNLMVPYHQNLPSGVYDKLLITIVGTIKPSPDKITVDLNSGSDVAFHINPRFNENGRRVIVRNSCFSNKWGHEERDLGAFPFVPGQQFEMKILCTNNEFKVAVNNSHLLSYQHRLKNLSSIKHLNIYNDLTLSKVTVETMH